jgi:UDP-glucose 4-epimerase
LSKRVLVTGGAGFIGSHMADRLLALGHEVVILDNESTGRLANVPSQAHYIRGDVRRPEDLDRAFSRGLDGVFHIAGQASTIRSFQDPYDDLDVNVVGTLNVVQKCLAYGVPRMLFASSMTAYGHLEELPIRESARCKPVSYYGVTKYAAERYVQATAERIDLTAPFQATSFRMFNVYGDRQRLDNPYQGVVGIFIGNVLRGEPIVIHGDGSQSRDFVHIDDVVDAWVTAWLEPEAYNKVFNLGTGSGYSIKQLAEAVIRAVGRSPESYPLIYEGRRPGDQEHMAADISLARQLLRWQPSVVFEQGIKATVQWARSGEGAPGR